MNRYRLISISVISLSVVAIIIGGMMFGIPMYGRYTASMGGQAEFMRAEQNRKIKVLEAQAAKESAVMLAEAEVERARGVAQANQIIGESLKNNEAYLRYLWVTTMQGGNDQVIYVPTEAGIPIMEAGRIAK